MWRFLGVVDHGRRRRFDVILEHRTDRFEDAWRQRRGIDGVHHVADPTIAFGLSDHERKVARPEAGMAAFLGVRGRPAPELAEEQGCSPPGVGEVIGVDRSNDGIELDPIEEVVDDGLEIGRAANGFIQRHLHLFTSCWIGSRVRRVVLWSHCFTLPIVRRLPEAIGLGYPRRRELWNAPPCSPVPSGMVLLMAEPPVRESPSNDATAAFERYVLPELDVMYRTARSLTGNQADAEDLVQDTLVRAFRAIERFDGRYPRAWLLTILRNANINRARKKKPDLLDDPDMSFERSLDFAEPDTPESITLAPVFDAVVEDAFARLSPDFRQIVELVDLDGLAYQEAADVLDIPVGTVMSRLHRARRKIRAEIAERGLESQQVDEDHR